METTDRAGRRCRTHDTLEDVTRRLIADFPAMDPHAVARQVAHAVTAVVWIGLAEDELLVVELIARAQLELQSGQRHDAARLDPQASHRKRRVGLRTEVSGG